MPALPETESVSLESLVFAHGGNPDSYLVTEPDYRHFIDDEQTGCIGYVQDGRYLHIVGGVIAPPERKFAVLQQFTQMVQQHRFLPSFFSIPAEDLDLFRQLGYQVTKFGENSTLALNGHSWQGKEYSWIRRQVSYVKRQGLVYREIDLTRCTAAERRVIFEQLQAINTAQLSERVLKHEIGLLEGRLYAEHFYRRRLFVATQADQPDRLEAFVVCTPMLGGKGWATEMYRSREDAVRGAIPFVFAQLIDQLQAEGSETVSLCMIPAINCTEPLPGDSKMARFLFGFWEKRLNFLFNTQGLYHFKSRFRPEFTPVYLCVYPRITLGSTWSFIRCVGVLKMDWKNWFKRSRPKQESPAANSDA